MAVHVSITDNLRLAVQHEDDSTLWVDTGGTNDAVVTDPVGRWDDQSGNGDNLTEGTTSAKPTRQSDGLEFVSNDRIGNNTIGAIASGGGNFSIYMALNPNNLGAYGPIFGFGNSSTESYIAFGANDDATQYGFASVANGSGYSEVAGGSIDTSLVCVTVIRNGSTITAYIDNSQVVQDTGISSPTTNRFHLGALMAFGTFVAYGAYDELKCCYVYDVAHDSSDRTTLYNDIDGTYINPSTDQSVTLSGSITLDHVLSDTTASLDTAQSKTLESIGLDFILSDVVASNDDPQSKTLTGITVDHVLSDTTAANDVTAVTLEPVTFDIVLPDVSVSNAEAQSKTLELIAFDVVVSDVVGSRDASQSRTLDPVIFDVSLADTPVGFDDPQGKTLDALTLDVVVSDATAANAGDSLDLGTIGFGFVLSDVIVSNDDPQSQTLNAINLSVHVADVNPNVDTPQSRTLDGLTFALVIPDATEANDAPQARTLTSIGYLFTLSDTVIGLDAVQNRNLETLPWGFVLADVDPTNAGATTVNLSDATVTLHYHGAASAVVRLSGDVQTVVVYHSQIATRVQAASDVQTELVYHSEGSAIVEPES